MGESRTILVGDWLAEPARNLLQRAGESIRIKPRSMEVLVYLAEHAGEVVSTDELINAVWRGRVVGDGTVYQCITNLRQAFGDNPGEASYIETIPKRGYRLIAPVAVPSPAIDVIGSRWKLGLAGSAISILTVGALLLALDRGPVVLERSVAVLPFETLSPDTEDAYFSDGFHASVVTQLSRITSLKVISRRSVLEYRDSPRKAREIGTELGVASLLEGSIQRTDNNIRVNVQLVDAQTDEQIWGEIYDRVLTAENIFAIQSAMANSIAETLRAMLLPEEIVRLAEVPTANLRAYNFYVSGNEYLERVDNLSAYQLAAQQYERSVAEDSGFALAWAALSRAHSGVYFFAVDTTEARRERAREAVEQAFQLAPGLPEAHLAQGYYYYRVFHDYERALQEWALAEPGLQGDSQLYSARARVYRRMGNFERAIAEMERAIELDPRNIEQLINQALAYEELGDIAGAEQWFDRALEIAPDDRFANIEKALIQLRHNGDVSFIKSLAEDPPMELGADRHWLRWTVALYEREFEQALSIVDGAQRQINEMDWQYRSRPNAWYGVSYQLAGMPDRALPYLQAARADAEQALLDDPDNPWWLISLAEASAYLGEAQLAVELARRAIERLPTSKDALWGPNVQLFAIMVLIAAGEHDAAIDELDAYLAGPGLWTIEGLLRDPRLDPIRDDARFQALVEK